MPCMIKFPQRFVHTQCGLLPSSQQIDGPIHDLPSISDLIAALQSCKKQKDLSLAKKLYAHIRGFGLGKNDSIDIHLISMFLECGSCLDAQQIILQLPQYDEKIWTSLICGYVEHGKLHNAFDMYERMGKACVSPTCYTLMPFVKAYANTRDVERGQYMHIQIVKYGFETDIFTGSGLVDMYAKCGLLHEARHVFNNMPLVTIVSWTALIAGYAEHGPCEEAFQCYDQMKQQGVSLDASTLVCILKACASVRSLYKGREAHVDSVLRGLDSNNFLGNSLIDMYAKCGSLTDAQVTSNNLPSRDIVSWTALISGYAEHGPGVEALHCFEKMKLEGIYPDAVTFASALKACGSIGALESGQEIHREIPPRYLEKYFFLGNAVVDMYLKCDSFVKAKEVFDKLQQRDLAPWHALIAGYAERGNSKQVMECVKCMQLEGVFLDSGAYVSMLKACASTESMQKNQELHAEIMKKGFERDTSVGNTLVDMYSKQGAVKEAREIFDTLLVRDVVSWTALIAGYVEGNHPQEAIAFFDQMHVEGVSPNDVTLVCVLKSCVDMGAINKGHEVHSDIMRNGFEGDVSICNSLIDMYARCGSLPEAEGIFYNIPHRDIVSWNSMIRGYGMNHEVDIALQCFEEMHRHGVQPDNITFTCLLYACSRAKLLHKGQDIFNMMMEEYAISPTIDHYTCMVDLFAKSGYLVEIEDFLEPVSGTSLWTALLTACKMHGERDIGNRCFQQLVCANPDQAAPYILMAKTYLGDELLDDGS